MAAIEYILPMAPAVMEIDARSPLVAANEDLSPELDPFLKTESTFE